MPTYLLLVLIALAALACVAEPLIWLPEKIAHSQNEGWSAFHIQAITGDDPLYPPPEASISNNYPPLSYLVVAALKGQSGDAVRTGRVVALIALLVVAICLAWMVTTLTSSTTIALFTGLLAVGSMGAHYQVYVAMNDPQMLGHALQYLGLAFVLTRGERRAPVVASALLMLCGGLVKHNLVPVPLVTAFWLFSHRRPHRFAWVLSALVLTAFALVILRTLFGPEFLSSVLTHPRSYDFHLLPRALESWLVPIAPLMIGGWIVLVLPRTDSRVDLLLGVALVALAFAVLTSLGRGMSYNAVFDLLFTLCALCGIAAQQLALRGAQVGVGSRPRLLAAAFGAFASTLFLVTPLRAYRAMEAFEERPVARNIAREDIEFVRAQPGPALCEDPALCYWAGKSFEVDFFNLGQKIANGVLDDAALANRIAQRQFGVVQVYQQGGSIHLGETLNRTILEHYELARRSSVNGWFYVPRAAQRPPDAGTSEPGAPATPTELKGTRGTDQ